MQQRTFLLTIVFFFGISFFGLNPDYRSEALAANDVKFEAGIPDFKTAVLNKDFTTEIKSGETLFSIKQNTRNTKSKPPKDQTTLKEKCRGTLDRSTQLSQSAIINPAILFLGALLHAKSLINHFALIKYSSWTGNCTKIRPPPFL